MGQGDSKESGRMKYYKSLGMSAAAQADDGTLRVHTPRILQRYHQQEPRTHPEWESIPSIVVTDEFTHPREMTEMGEGAGIENMNTDEPLAENAEKTWSPEQDLSDSDLDDNNETNLEERQIKMETAQLAETTNISSVNNSSYNEGSKQDKPDLIRRLSSKSRKRSSMKNKENAPMRNRLSKKKRHASKEDIWQECMDEYSIKFLKDSKKKKFPKNTPAPQKLDDSRYDNMHTIFAKTLPMPLKTTPLGYASVKDVDDSREHTDTFIQNWVTLRKVEKDGMISDSKQRSEEHEKNTHVPLRRISDSMIERKEQKDWRYSEPVQEDFRNILRSISPHSPPDSPHSKTEFFSTTEDKTLDISHSQDGAALPVEPYAVVDVNSGERMNLSVRRPMKLGVGGIKQDFYHDTTLSDLKISTDPQLRSRYIIDQGSETPTSREYIELTNETYHESFPSSDNAGQGGQNIQDQKSYDLLRQKSEERSPSVEYMELEAQTLSDTREVVNGQIGATERNFAVEYYTDHHNFSGEAEATSRANDQWSKEKGMASSTDNNHIDSSFVEKKYFPTETEIKMFNLKNDTDVVKHISHIQQEDLVPVLVTNEQMATNYLDKKDSFKHIGKASELKVTNFLSASESPSPERSRKRPPEDAKSHLAASHNLSMHYNKDTAQQAERVISPESQAATDISASLYHSSLVESEIEIPSGSTSPHTRTPSPTLEEHERPFSDIQSPAFGRFEDTVTPLVSKDNIYDDAHQVFIDTDRSTTSSKNYESNSIAGHLRVSSEHTELETIPEKVGSINTTQLQDQGEETEIKILEHDAGDTSKLSDFSMPHSNSGEVHRYMLSGGKEIKAEHNGGYGEKVLHFDQIESNRYKPSRKMYNTKLVSGVNRFGNIPMGISSELASMKQSRKKYNSSPYFWKESEHQDGHTSFSGDQNFVTTYTEGGVKVTKYRHSEHDEIKPGEIDALVEQHVKTNLELFPDKKSGMIKFQENINIHKQVKDVPPLQMETVGDVSMATLERADAQVPPGNGPKLPKARDATQEHFVPSVVVDESNIYMELLPVEENTNKGAMSNYHRLGEQSQGNTDLQQSTTTEMKIYKNSSDSDKVKAETAQHQTTRGNEDAMSIDDRIDSYFKDIDTKSRHIVRSTTNVNQGAKDEDSGHVRKLNVIRQSEQDTSRPAVLDRHQPAQSVISKVTSWMQNRDRESGTTRDHLKGNLDLNQIENEDLNNIIEKIPVDHQTIAGDVEIKSSALREDSHSSSAREVQIKSRTTPEDNHSSSAREVQIKSRTTPEDNHSLSAREVQIKSSARPQDNHLSAREVKIKSGRPQDNHSLSAREVESKTRAIPKDNHSLTGDGYGKNQAPGIDERSAEQMGFESGASPEIDRRFVSEMHLANQAPRISKTSTEEVYIENRTLPGYTDASMSNNFQTRNEVKQGQEYDEITIDRTITKELVDVENEIPDEPDVTCDNVSDIISTIFEIGGRVSKISPAKKKRKQEKGESGNEKVDNGDSYDPGTSPDKAQPRRPTKNRENPTDDDISLNMPHLNSSKMPARENIYASSPTSRPQTQEEQAYSENGKMPDKTGLSNENDKKDSNLPHPENPEFSGDKGKFSTPGGISEADEVNNPRVPLSSQDQEPFHVTKLHDTNPDTSDQVDNLGSRPLTRNPVTRPRRTNLRKGRSTYGNYPTSFIDTTILEPEVDPYPDKPYLSPYSKMLKARIDELNNATIFVDKTVERTQGEGAVPTEIDPSVIRDHDITQETNAIATAYINGQPRKVTLCMSEEVFFFRTKEPEKTEVTTISESVTTRNERTHFDTKQEVFAESKIENQDKGKVSSRKVEPIESVPTLTEPRISENTNIKLQTKVQNSPEKDISDKPKAPERTEPASSAPVKSTSDPETVLPAESLEEFQPSTKKPIHEVFVEEEIVAEMVKPKDFNIEWPAVDMIHEKEQEPKTFSQSNETQMDIKEGTTFKVENRPEKSNEYRPTDHIAEKTQSRIEKPSESESIPENHTPNSQDNTSRNEEGKEPAFETRPIPNEKSINAVFDSDHVPKKKATGEGTTMTEKVTSKEEIIMTEPLPKERVEEEQEVGTHIEDYEAEEETQEIVTNLEHEYEEEEYQETSERFDDDFETESLRYTPTEKEPKPDIPTIVAGLTESDQVKHEGNVPQMTFSIMSFDIHNSALKGFTGSTDTLRSSMGTPDTVKSATIDFRPESAASSVPSGIVSPGAESSKSFTFVIPPQEARDNPPARKNMTNVSLTIPNPQKDSTENYMSVRETTEEKVVQALDEHGNPLAPPQRSVETLKTLFQSPQNQNPYDISTLDKDSSTSFLGPTISYSLTNGRNQKPGTLQEGIPQTHSITFRSASSNEPSLQGYTVEETVVREKQFSPNVPNPSTANLALSDSLERPSSIMTSPMPSQLDKPPNTHLQGTLQEGVPQTHSITFRPASSNEPSIQGYTMEETVVREKQFPSSATPSKSTSNLALSESPDRLSSIASPMPTRLEKSPMPPLQVQASQKGPDSSHPRSPSATTISHVFPQKSGGGKAVPHRNPTGYPITSSRQNSPEVFSSPTSTMSQGPPHWKKTGQAPTRKQSPGPPNRPYSPSASAISQHRSSKSGHFHQQSLASRNMSATSPVYQISVKGQGTGTVGSPPRTHKHPTSRIDKGTGLKGHSSNMPQSASSKQNSVQQLSRRGEGFHVQKGYKAVGVTQEEFVDRYGVGRQPARPQKGKWSSMSMGNI